MVDDPPSRSSHPKIYGPISTGGPRNLCRDEDIRESTRPRGLSRNIRATNGRESRKYVVQPCATFKAILQNCGTTDTLLK